MKSLVEAFLLLARESDGSLTTEPVNVNDLLAEEAERFRPLLEGKPVELNIKTNCQLEVNAPSKVFVGNYFKFSGQCRDVYRSRSHRPHYRHR